MQARLDAFCAGKGATRAGCHATETTAGSGFAWLTSDDSVAFISDGRLSLALQGSAEGLEGVEADDGLNGAEVRRACARQQRAAAAAAAAARSSAAAAAARTSGQRTTQRGAQRHPPRDAAAAAAIARHRAAYLAAAAALAARGARSAALPRAGRLRRPRLTQPTQR